MRRITVALAGLLAVAACSSPAPVQPTTVQSAPSGPSPSRQPSSTATTRATASPVARPRPTPPRVTVTRMRTPDGSVMTVATFSGPLTYVLHDGSEDPGAAAGRVRAGPAVRGAERTRLLAAFNGGFKLSQGVGGYEQEGHVASPLRRGVTSLVIDRSGRARIGIWGHGVPASGEAVYSVRQNLPSGSAAARTWPAARSARTRPATWCTPQACPRPRPTWRACWPTRAPRSRWSSTSTPSGCSWTWPAARAGGTDPLAGALAVTIGIGRHGQVDDAPCRPPDHAAPAGAGG